MAKDIRSAEEILNIEGLTSGEIASFQKIDPTDSANLNRFFSSIEAQRPDIHIDRGAVQGQLLEHQAKQQEQTLQPQEPTLQPSLSGAGSVLGAVGAGLLHSATADSSNAWEVTNDINDKQVEELFGEKSPFGGPLSEGSLEGVQGELDRLDPDKLLDDQFRHLKERLAEANADPKTIQNLEDRLQNVKDKRADEKSKNPKKYKREADTHVKQERVARNLLNKRLEEINSSRKSDADKTRERRLALEQYARQQALRKFQQNNKDFEKEILSKRSGLRRRSTLNGRDKTVLLGKLKEEREAKWKKQKEAFQKRQVAEKEQRRQQRRSFFQPRKINVQVFVPEVTTASPEITTPTPPAQETGVGLPIPGKGIAAKAIFGGLGEPAAIIAIIAGVILFIIVLIIVVILLLNASGANGPGLDETATPVLCGDDIGAITHNNSTFDDHGVASAILDAYHITVATNIEHPNDDARNVAVVKSIFNSICLLFGHIKKDISSPAPTVLNTFGNLTVGNESQRDFAMKISYVIQFDVPDKPCNVWENTKNEPSNGSARNWVIDNPDQCMLSPGTLDFLLAQSLARNLVKQQVYLSKGKSNAQVYKDFESQILNPPNVLSTALCTKTVALEDCFADMVAAYLTWGIPYNTPLTPGPSISPAQKTATSSLLLQQLGTLGIYPQTFPTYYNFAEKNLFDGQPLFIFHGGRTPPYYPTDYPKAIFQEFGITLDTGGSSRWSQDYQKWAWEALWHMPDTFLNGIKNTTIVHIVSGGWSQTGCFHGDCNMYLRNTYSEKQFKIIFTHEFSHVFDFTNPESVKHRTEIDGIFAAERALTLYSQGDCIGGTDIQTKLKEDYAETLTYYMYPDSPESTDCSNGGNNDRFPYKNGAHPLHYNLAKEILGDL